ncbi:MAG: hypothetical protein PHG54_07405 [Smithellaceae bacterium]|mgnify:CR=1 FL=1|nr:hypothetical protein [Syntrophaceae bacterium]MDD4241243.1 hypothetical protein [Smithellaceae bacterium]NLX52505.1 hypothetical protein [Deltaproteobacteria bacterium]
MAKPAAAGTVVDDEILLLHLEQLAGQLDITVRHENLSGEEASGAGGLCRIEGEYVLILNSRAALDEQVQVALRALRRFNLEGMYVKPGIRGLLEKDDDS